MKIFAYLFASLCILAGAVCAGYIVIFWGIIEPVMEICKAIDANKVTASLIGWGVVKFLVRDIIAAVVFLIFVGIAYAVVEMVD